MNFEDPNEGSVKDYTLYRKISFLTENSIINAKNSVENACFSYFYTKISEIILKNRKFYNLFILID
jgi:hypothetical protein